MFEAMVDKKSLSERDICTKYITPAIISAGWELHTQFLEEVYFTAGKILVKGRLHTRGTANIAFPKAKRVIAKQKRFVSLNSSLSAIGGITELKVKSAGKLILM